MNIENPQLKRYLVLNEPLRKEHDTGIMHKLQKYVEDRKANFEANVPKPGQPAIWKSVKFNYSLMIQATFT